MRNIIIFGFVLALASCAMPAEEVKGVGFFTPLPEETFITGSDEITEIWTKYLDAHNNGDIESIKSMSADSIYVLGPDGTEIRTKEEQAELLEGWFAAANPTPTASLVLANSTLHWTPELHVFGAPVVLEDSIPLLL